MLDGPKQRSRRSSAEACGVDLYLGQQAIDTTTPSGELMLQMTGAFAEFERAMIQARIHAGLKRAVANGTMLGRPLNNPAAIEIARRALKDGLGINRVAKLVGLSNGKVQKIKAEIADGNGMVTGSRNGVLTGISIANADREAYHNQ
jgi:DNA invertase Pin-like site-specific DNA recombinase